MPNLNFGVPRRLSAEAVVRSFTGTFSGIRTLDAPAFIAAQLIGAALADVVLVWWFRSGPTESIQD